MALVLAIRITNNHTTVLAYGSTEEELFEKLIDIYASWVDMKDEPSAKEYITTLDQILELHNEASWSLDILEILHIPEIDIKSADKYISPFTGEEK